VGLPTQTEPQKGTTAVNSVSLGSASPIYDLLSKQKANLVDVSISIKINLPPKELYNVLTSSFDGADEEIVNYVVSSVNVEDIKSALSDSILNKYYKREKKEDLKETQNTDAKEE
jgi:hypothetical protein